MLTTVASALADEAPEQISVHQEISNRISSSLTNFMAERSENIISVTIGFTWAEFQELSQSLRLP
jgi:hypothetical protein